MSVATLLPIGMAVELDPFYGIDWAPGNAGVIVSRRWNRELGFIDYTVRFPCGREFPFGAHEFLKKAA